jgi:hypothetical protein
MNKQTDKRTDTTYPYILKKAHLTLALINLTDRHNASRRFPRDPAGFPSGPIVTPRHTSD